ncbi:uroporphyrinogen-III C-methyltransferase [Arenimonas fontis]|uniref:Uroporphyrin-III methyltransferase n=1 Tax=Arenimonas fontis TaxID=2608255 RepID=A0A5B2Z9Q5_9GAMM|nr:uroporphyrinogen-III C-methyltransferase [Arenimonas fontis]KAA2284749.1 hypothetical protein F0415_08620 [Arenimonas fontis]
MNSVLDETSDTPRPRHRFGALGWLLVLLVLAAIMAGGWRWWSSRAPANAGPDLSPEALDARLLEVEQAVASLRRTQQGLEQRVADAQARAGLLRDEVLAVGERAAILEDSLRELGAQASEGTESLRLDEAELLLSLAQSRLAVAGDLEGAIRATALAQQALAPLTSPEYLNLRQTVARELAALQALPDDPRSRAAGELDALQAALPGLASRAPGADADTPADTSTWRRLADAVIQVRPSHAQDLISPDDRAAGEAALGLELALARTALERRDETAFRAALQRVEQWLLRLYAEDEALRAERERLARLGRLNLMPDLPARGVALRQLRDLRRGRSDP